MKRHLLFFIIILLVLSSFACSNESEYVKVAKETDWLTEYSNYVQETMQSDNIPGLALAVVRGDEIILAEGYGLRDVARNAPVTTDTLFHIGSTQKSMTAMMIATLVDDGLLDWDEPVINFAPGFGLSDPQATQEVTIRHLLSMRGGIPDEAEDDLNEWAGVDGVFDVIRKTPLLGMPGEKFSYSNLSVAAGGYLGVLASGDEETDLHAGYGRALQERVLNPIGMETATMYASEARQNPNYSLSYVLSRQGTPILSESYDFDEDELAPAGSLKVNVMEMGLYVATQLNRGVAPNGQRVVSKENLEQTWQPYLENYGMGWEVQSYEGTRLIFHTGAYDDYGSVIGFVPDLDVGFVILLNCEVAGDSLVENAPYVFVEQLLAK